MKDPLLATMDIGSGPRDPGLLNLLRDQVITGEEIERVTSFIKLIDSSLLPQYSTLVKEVFPGRAERVKDFLTELAIKTLHTLGYHWSFDFEWPRTEMVDWERADVRGFKKSDNWQHSYGYRFWKPSEIVDQIEYTNSERHIEELGRIQKFAKRQIGFPISDAHCEIHANDNPFYYGRWLEKERDELLASFFADHEATMEFARKVTLNRVRELSEHSLDGQEIAVQLDNFVVTCEEREFDREILRRMKFDLPSFIQALKESTPSYPNVRYFIHNCLQDYSLYVPYLLEVPNIEKFCLEMSSHDSDELGTTDEKRRGQGFRSLKLFKEYGLGKNQVVGVGVASTYEGAKPPAPELVRDRILYAVKVLDDPWKVQPVLDCGQRNLDLRTIYEIGINVHKGRDLALAEIGKNHGIDVEPSLTQNGSERQAIK
jgi:methionine synthase II (cobalamin-independent)